MSKKILLADDSITIQKVIELTFSDEDFEVVTVGNGRLAIERVQDVRPDLVLCDIIMPEKDGYEVCEFIKKNSSLARTPVLLLTGAFEPFDQERATRVGCDGFLAKPFEPQTLIAKVKDLLSRAGSPASAPGPSAVPTPTASPAPSAAAASAPPAWVAHAPAPAASAPARRGPETFAFVPEPPPAYAPPPPPPALPFEEAGVSFFTDETFEEMPDNTPAAAPAARSGETVPVPTFPETPDFEDYRASAFDEVAPPAPSAPTAPPRAASAPAPAARPVTAPSAFPALDEEEEAQTLLPVTSEEAATLRGEATPPARTPARAPLWTQQTMEVPLESRARAAVETVQVESEPVFEEVFEPAAAPVSAAPPREPMPAPRPVVRAEAPPPAPKPAPAPSTPAVSSAPAPSPAPVGRSGHDDPAMLSVGSVPAGAGGRSSVPSSATPAEVAAAVPSTPGRTGQAPPAADVAASGVSVPVEMVSQIAQRVVAQISEKVIREVAWEVIPELAEGLIKKEIERLKAELQRT